ncbi:hypothetical protein O6H91_13G094400 [Diphasiastrum complanatum]|uniref:Uncharacterized protein n=1 Tax=Diphasiastrum complanatum TaxID=34168 RepID=A0ACC2BXD2_DIPCM|nr:hypothetical protein O6H91_13G094400 [Diphasiastrum complanatum]
MILFSKAFAHKEQTKVIPPVSGGGLSEDGRFSYGYSSLCGRRASMEDYFETRISRVNDQVVGLFGVFDGHGGARAAEYVKQNLLDNLLNHPQFVTDTKEAIAEVYRQTDLDYLKIADNNPQRDCGSTASTAVLVGDRLIVANVGDSRVVLCRGGQAVPLSTDHKPNRLDERQRIEQAGGVVLWAGTWRVGGILAVSRAFGDKTLKKYICADPDIQEEVIKEDVEFIVLASDGLWDVITNKDAVALVKSMFDPESAAQRLSEEALRRGSADNITTIVVRFHHEVPLPMQPSLAHELEM